MHRLRNVGPLPRKHVVSRSNRLWRLVIERHFGGISCGSDGIVHGDYFRNDVACLGGTLASARTAHRAQPFTVDFVSDLPQIDAASKVGKVGRYALANA